jgi:gliding motility-associated-like protein
VGITNGYLLPNAFTPNGDGKNDCFGVSTWGNVGNLKLQIFNRWGELVFSTTDPNKCWDGTYKGLRQPSGAFIYQISAETICGPVYRRGTVVLIR